MESTRQRPSEPPPHATGIVSDLHRLKSDGSATASEIREFMARMRGRSPQEMLGVVAESGLVRSTLLATAGIAAVLVLLTVGPYWLKGSGKETVAETSAPAEAATETASAPQPAAEQSDPAAPPQVDPTAANGEQAVDALGIGETRTAAPDVNPLDSNLDTLLDGID